MSIDPVGPDSPTSPEMVRWAFLAILGRPADTDYVVEFHQRIFPRFEDLCNGLKDSQEFAMLRAARAAELSVLMPELSDPALKTVAASLCHAMLGRGPDDGEMTTCLVALRQVGGLAGVGRLAAIQAAVLGGPQSGLRVALPPRPPAPWRFVGRDRQMAALMYWFVQAEARRLFLEGPDGAGRAALASEFGRRLQSAGGRAVMPGFAGLNHILFVASDTGLAGPDHAGEMFSRILNAAGLRDATSQADGLDALDAQLTGFLDTSNGLIIIDGPTDTEFDERLHVKALSSRGQSMLLYTHAPPNHSALEPSIPVAGFSEDDEYRAFFGTCAAQFGTPAPRPEEYEAIARWSHGLPRRIETLFERRRVAGSFAEAMVAVRGSGLGA